MEDICTEKISVNEFTFKDSTKTNKHIKQETDDEELNIDIQKGYLKNSCLDIEESIGISTYKTNSDWASEYSFKVKSEVGFDSGLKEFNLKREIEVETVKFKTEQTKIEIDDSVNMQNDIKDYIQYDIHGVAFKQEFDIRECKVDFGEHELSESCINDETIIESSSNKLGFNGKINKVEKPETNNQTDKKLFQCNMCGFTFKYKRDLRRHMGYKHNEEAKWFNCNFCAYKTKRTDVLMRHLKQHNENKKKYNCQFCEFETKNQLALSKHINQKHKEMGNDVIGLYQCQSCECKYKYKDSLKKHIYYKHNENAKWFQCNFCDYRSKYKSCLLDHFKTRHDQNPEMYSCQFCGYKSKSRGDLKKHVRCKHDRKVYHCQFCESVYESKVILRKHIKCTHNKNVKPFV